MIHSRACMIVCLHDMIHPPAHPLTPTHPHMRRLKPLTPTIKDGGLPQLSTLLVCLLSSEDTLKKIAATPGLKSHSPSDQGGDKSAKWGTFILPVHEQVKAAIAGGLELPKRFLDGPAVRHACMCEPLHRHGHWPAMRVCVSPCTDTDTDTDQHRTGHRPTPPHPHMHRRRWTRRRTPSAAAPARSPGGLGTRCI